MCMRMFNYVAVAWRLDCNVQVFPCYYSLGLEYGISGAVIYTLNSNTLKYCLV